MKAVTGCYPSVREAAPADSGGTNTDTHGRRTVLNGMRTVKNGMRTVENGMRTVGTRRRPSQAVHTRIYTLATRCKAGIRTV